MKQDTVPVKIRFISIMQNYSGKRKVVEIDLPCDPKKSINHIIRQFKLPWNGKLERFVRIFINRELSNDFIKNGKQLQAGDIISFIPMSGGG